MGVIRKILAYMPTFSPDEDVNPELSRPFTRLSNKEIGRRLKKHRNKPWVYFDAIDSICNNPTFVRLVVGDGRSTESIRSALGEHQRLAGGYELRLYPEKMSQWIIFNDIFENYATRETEYFVYSSSDIIWTMDWVAEAIAEFERDSSLQILFPCVGRGDMNASWQVAACPRDIDPYEPPYQAAARAPVLNMYVAIFRASFLAAYGGYPTIFANCFSESFLHYMVSAVGGKMKVLPRGFCYHHSEADKWKDDSGGSYNYTREKPVFDKIMDEVLKKRFRGEMTVEYLRDTLRCGNREW